MTPPPTDQDTVRVGVLLAGGESRRMGLDKRGLRLGGDTLLQRNLAFLGGIFPVVGLSVRSADQAPPDLPADVVVIPDEVPGSPLAGLASVARPPRRAGLRHGGRPDRARSRRRRARARGVP